MAQLLNAKSSNRPSVPTANSVASFGRTGIVERSTSETGVVDGEPGSTIEFEAAYAAYGSMVYRLAMVYLGCSADAEDVMQESWLPIMWKSYSQGNHGQMLRLCAVPVVSR